MENSTETIEPIKFQWIKGDKIGNIETVSGTDHEWTLFESGARISSSLINEFMIPITTYDAPLDFTSSPQPAPVERRRDRSPRTGSVQASHIEKSPIRILFDKQKNTDNITLNLSLNITVPKNDIFDIMCVSFDAEEVTKELYMFIADQIKDDQLKDVVREGITSLIDQRYA